MTVATSAKLALLTDVLIVQTWYVEHEQNGTYWEIHFAKQPGKKFGLRGHECRGLCTVLLTREAELAKRAEASESHLQRFQVQWTSGRQPDGVQVKVLLGLEVQPRRLDDADNDRTTQ